MARWQASSQAGRAALLSPDDLALYGSIYSFMANFNAAMADEQRDWARLRSLEHLRRLTPEVAFQLNTTLQEARYINWRIGVWTMQTVSLADRLHLKQVRNDVPASRSACIPMSTPRDQAVTQSNSAYQKESWRSAGALTESERAQEECILLPLFHLLTESDQRKIATELRAALTAPVAV